VHHVCVAHMHAPRVVLHEDLVWAIIQGVPTPHVGRSLRVWQTLSMISRLAQHLRMHGSKLGWHNGGAQGDNASRNGTVP